MKSVPAGIREHVQCVVLGFGSVDFVWCAEGLMLRPVTLPFFLDVFEWIYGHDVPVFRWVKSEDCPLKDGEIQVLIGLFWRWQVVRVAVDSKLLIPEAIFKV